MALLQEVSSSPDLPLEVSLTKDQKAEHAKAEKIVADVTAAADAMVNAWTPLPAENMDIDRKEAAPVEVTSKEVDAMLPDATPEEGKRVMEGQEAVQVAD